MTSQAAVTESMARPAARRDLPRWAGFLAPAVNGVARIRAPVHVKLLTGFLLSALLLLGMGALSLSTIRHMSQEAERTDLLYQRSALAHEIQTLVITESHDREVAIATHNDALNHDVTAYKQRFAQDLNQLQALSPASEAPFFRQVRAIDAQFDASGAKVVAAFDAGRYDEALTLHLTQEHPISHEIEDAMVQLQASLDTQRAAEQAAFDRDVRNVNLTVAGFSAASLVIAVMLGLILSLSFVRPVRGVDAGLARLATGDFGHEVVVPNRDEFGSLAGNLNAASRQLANLYSQLNVLNTRLRATVGEKLEELRQVSELRRYLSPQLASSIISGEIEVKHSFHRRNLTVLFADLHDFAAIAELTEPDELVEIVNQYLGSTTEILLKHGGTVDKYLGTSVRAFFGDPNPLEDHAERAIRAALEMRAALEPMARRWAVSAEPLKLSVGISTGYVTVGNIGASARLDYTVLGTYADLASALAARAAAGQILITERTLAATGGTLEARKVSALSLRGGRREFSVFELLGTKDRSPADASDEPDG